MSVERSEYKGNPVIKLTNEDGKYPFTFGFNKAKMIMDNLEEIKSFVSEVQEARDMKEQELSAEEEAMREMNEME
jgi:hypothetical protein